MQRFLLVLAVGLSGLASVVHAEPSLDEAEAAWLAGERRDIGYAGTPDAREDGA